MYNYRDRETHSKLRINYGYQQIENALLLAYNEIKGGIQLVWLINTQSHAIAI